MKLAASGVICFYTATKVKRALGYDDALDAFGVHAVGGIVGALLTGVFVSAALGGVGFSEGVTMGKQLYVQAVAVLATIVYDAIVSFILLKVIDAVIGLRVSADEETEGLDVVLHDERAYDI